jgi:hypothetical protein
MRRALFLRLGLLPALAIAAGLGLGVALVSAPASTPSRPQTAGGTPVGPGADAPAIRLVHAVDGIVVRPTVKEPRSLPAAVVAWSVLAALLASGRRPRLRRAVSAQHAPVRRTPARAPPAFVAPLT